jgi:hypothetical protein
VGYRANPIQFCPHKVYISFSGGFPDLFRGHINNKRPEGKCQPVDDKKILTGIVNISIPACATPSEIVGFPVVLADRIAAELYYIRAEAGVLHHAVVNILEHQPGPAFSMILGLSV